MSGSDNRTFYVELRNYSSNSSTTFYRNLIPFVCILENWLTQLDHAEIQLVDKSKGRSKLKCSEYPFVMARPGIAMRINCWPLARLFSEVELNSYVNKGYDLAEVEVHTLGIQTKMS